VKCDWIGFGFEFGLLNWAVCHMSDGIDDGIVWAN